MMTIINAALGLLRFVNSNAAIALLIAGGAFTAYAVLAMYHYNRGWVAHEAVIAAEIREVNEERNELTATLAKERLQAGARNAQASADAVTATQAYCRENPEACGIPVEAKAGRGGWRTTVHPAQPSGCAKACSTPASVSARLNRIE